jgi:L-amino acid N-acyltransferase
MTPAAIPAATIVPAAFARHGAAVQSIFNEVIANSTALYEYQPRSLGVVEDWFRARADVGLPILAAEDASGELLGFASFGPFRAFPAYQYTAEHSVYVRADSRGRGVGNALLAAVIGAASTRGLRVLVGGIDHANHASIALHERHGFTHAGTIREAGFKFGRWLDLAFYQRILAGPAEPRDG